MASDPTDLIREADDATAAEADRDDALQQLAEARADYGECSEHLIASEMECSKLRAALAEERAYYAHLRDEVTRAKEWRDVNLVADLAEANAAIERVRHVLDLAGPRANDYLPPGSDVMRGFVARLRRAIKGEH